jgi:hypothetical protein
MPEVSYQHSLPGDLFLSRSWPKLLKAAGPSLGACLLGQERANYGGEAMGAG